jgi:hypothetical protein
LNASTAFCEKIDTDECRHRGLSSINAISFFMQTAIEGADNHMLHRISVWGLLAGWLTLAFAAKTLRGDAAGVWVLLSPILVIGIGLLVISSIGVYVATFSSRSTVAHQIQQSQQERENHTV